MLINPDKKRTGTLRTSQYDGLLYISFLSLFLIVLTKAIKRFWFDSNYECPLWDKSEIDRGFLALDFIGEIFQNLKLYIVSPNIFKVFRETFLKKILRKTS